MQIAATGRTPTTVKSGVRALESRMPGKRACPVWRRGRRKRAGQPVPRRRPTLLGEGRTEKAWQQDLAGRLLYWLLGFSGPRQEAEEIKLRIGTFLRETLKLELSQTKTLITHARTQAARFLGYEIAVAYNDQKHDRRGHRSLNGQVALNVPLDVVRAHCAPHLRHGKAIHRAELLHDSAYSIVAQYQQEYRGVVEYDQLASNLYQLNRLKWHTERSLTQTLAHKFRTSVSTVYRRYQATLQTPR